MTAKSEIIENILYFIKILYSKGFIYGKKEK